MNEVDDIILEYLREIHPSGEPPTVIYGNIMRRSEEFRVETRTNDGFSKDTLRRRLKRLEDRGLVEVIREPGYWRAITEDGLDYLEGEFDASST